LTFDTTGLALNTTTYSTYLQKSHQTAC